MSFGVSTNWGWGWGARNKILSLSLLLIYQWGTPIALDLPVITPPVSVLRVLVTVDENIVTVMWCYGHVSVATHWLQMCSTNPYCCHFIVTWPHNLNYTGCICRHHHLPQQSPSNWVGISQWYSLTRCVYRDGHWINRWVHYGVRTKIQGGVMRKLKQYLNLNHMP